MHIEIKNDSGIIIYTAVIEPREFKSGSRGYFSTGKLTINDKQHRVNVLIYEKNSKPQPESLTDDEVIAAYDKGHKDMTMT